MSIWNIHFNRPKVCIYMLNFICKPLKDENESAKENEQEVLESIVLTDVGS